VGLRRGPRRPRGRRHPRRRPRRRRLHAGVRPSARWWRSASPS
jgi:hypothetical protein